MFHTQFDAVCGRMQEAERTVRSAACGRFPIGGFNAQGERGPGDARSGLIRDEPVNLVRRLGEWSAYTQNLWRKFEA
jgi:hypothetical protein